MLLRMFVGSFWPHFLCPFSICRSFRIISLLLLFCCIFSLLTQTVRGRPYCDTVLGLLGIVLTIVLGRQNSVILGQFEAD